MSNRKKPRLLYYEILKYQKSNIDILNDYFEVTTLPDPDYNQPGTLNEIEVLLAPLGFFFGQDIIDACPNLRIIGSNTTGEPHVDRAYAESRGISVVSLKDDQEFLNRVTPTAEHTWGLILAVTRRVPWAFNAVLNGEWNRRSFGARKMLSEMDLGIVGLGRLGKMIAGYGEAFRMNVRYYDPYVNEIESLILEKAGTLYELVHTSDIVSVHVPLNNETKGLINKEVFRHFKNGAYLINTSRAEIVDKHFLLKSLQSKRLAGAGLDVLDGEFQKGFDASAHELVNYAKEHDNLLITPHIGGSTIDAWTKTEGRIIKKLISFCSGKTES